MSFTPSKSLTKGLTSLLTSGKYSDLTITTQHRSFKVHKAIICPQSKVLAAMSDSGFKESSTSSLQLEHDDPATVERMITFFYTGTYDQGNPHVGTRDATPFVGPILMANTLVYSIADKYDIDALKIVAKAKFENLSFAAWKCEDFPAVVAMVFDTTLDTDAGLRDIVSRICARHVDGILASDTWSDLLSTNGAIGLSVFKIAHRRSVEEVEEAGGEVEDRERHLDWAASCNDRLHKRFDEAYEELDTLIKYWSGYHEVEECESCADGLFVNLRSGLVGFKEGLPKKGESGFL